MLPGTLITNDCAETEEDTSINERRLASGVTHLTDLAQFRVALNPEDIASGRKLFEDLADARYQRRLFEFIREQCYVCCFCR